MLLVVYLKGIWFDPWINKATKTTWGKFSELPLIFLIALAIKIRRKTFKLREWNM